jgi:hypothetical protein
MLHVAISPEPRVVRRARRFKVLAELIEGWRGAEHGASTKMLKR